MDTLKFLQQMARKVHHDDGLNELISNQSLDVRTAYTLNDSSLLKQYLGESKYVANPTDVSYLT